MTLHSTAGGLVVRSLENSWDCCLWLRGAWSLQFGVARRLWLWRYLLCIDSVPWGVRWEGDVPEYLRLEKGWRGEGCGVFAGGWAGLRFRVAYIPLTHRLSGWHLACAGCQPAELAMTPDSVWLILQFVVLLFVGVCTAAAIVWTNNKRP